MNENDNYDTGRKSATVGWNEERWCEMSRGTKQERNNLAARLRRQIKSQFPEWAKFVRVRTTVVNLDGPCRFPNWGQIVIERPTFPEPHKPLEDYLVSQQKAARKDLRLFLTYPSRFEYCDTMGGCDKYFSVPSAEWLIEDAYWWAFCNYTHMGNCKSYSQEALEQNRQFWNESIHHLPPTYWADRRLIVQQFDLLMQWCDNHRPTTATNCPRTSWTYGRIWWPPPMLLRIKFRVASVIFFRIGFRRKAVRHESTTY